MTYNAIAESVITDGMLLAAVQPLIAEQKGS